MEDKELFSSLQNGALFGLKDRDVKSIRIPDEARYICKGTFMGCPNLQTVYIPKSVEHIAGVSFMDCKNLQSVIFLDNDKRANTLVIDDRAFEGCTSLRAINLPERVELRRDVFSGCTSLDNAVIFSMYGKSIIHYLPSNQATEYRIPDEVTVIGKYAFKDCTSLQSIIIPEGLEQIDDFAFWGCTSLQSIVLPKDLTLIGYSAFCECKALHSIFIPKEVTCIEGDDVGYGFYGAFKDCTSLKTIHCAILNPKDIEIGEDVFEGVDMDECTLFVPVNTLDEYRSHPIFGHFREIIEERV